MAERLSMTRTVTVADVRAAIIDAELRITVRNVLGDDPPLHPSEAAAAIFAALPTSTEGLDVDTLTAALWGMRFDPDARRFAQKIAAEYARLASLSPSPTEDPA